MSDGVFRRVFDADPDVVAEAPARANLLGEHTDYNDGFVLPTPLAYRTVVEAGADKGAPGGTLTMHAEQFGESAERRLGEPRRGDWTDYALGSVSVLAQQGIAVPPMRLAIDSDVPMGAGISSSAALEVSVLRAVRALLQIDIDDVTIAKLGQEAENGYVGMQCGIMDQMVSSLGTPGMALFLDTRDLSTDLVPLPTEERVAIIHCGVAHKLTEGGYNTRRQECEAACKVLDVPSLRALGPDDLDRIAALPDPLNRRARHVVTENQRVLDGVAALRAGDVATFGTLMNDSHRSQRDDYEVSIPEIDALAESAQRHGAIGARLTGGGFGGSIVALVPNAAYDDWLASVLADRPAAKPI